MSTGTRQILRYGMKISLVSEGQRQGLHLRATNSFLAQLGVPPTFEQSEKDFEQAVFLVTSGYQDFEMHRRFGEVVTYGASIRLVHVASNSLLCCHKTKRAWLEKAHHQVILERIDATATSSAAEMSANSKLKLTPKFRILSEGAVVSDRDVVLLQAHHDDNYLHLSTVGDKLLNDYLELNSAPGASGQLSGFYIMIYDSHVQMAGPGGEDAEARDTRIRCGDCLQIFHRQRGAVLCAELGDPVPYLEPLQSSDSEQNEDDVAALRTAMESGSGFLEAVLGTGAGGAAAAAAAGVAGTSHHVSGGPGSASMSMAGQSDYVVDIDAVGAAEGNQGADGGTHYATSSLFMAEDANSFVGGPLLMNSRRLYRLKNLSTGLYLAARRKSKETKHKEWEQREQRMSQGDENDSNNNGESSPPSPAKNQHYFDHNSQDEGTGMISAPATNPLASGETKQSGLQQAAAAMNCSEHWGTNNNSSNSNATTGVPRKLFGGLFPTLEDDWEVVLETSKTENSLLAFHSAGDASSPLVKHHTRMYMEFAMCQEEGLWMGSDDTSDIDQQQFQQHHQARMQSSASFGVTSSNGGSIGDVNHSSSADIFNQEMMLRHKNKIRLCLSTGVSPKDGVEIRRVPEQFYHKLNSVVALIPPIKHLLAALRLIDPEPGCAEYSSPNKKKRGAMPPLHLLQHTVDNLISMIRLVIPSSPDKNPLTRDGAPDASAQQRLVDQRVVFDVMSLIEHLARVGDLNPHSHDQVDQDTARLGPSGSTATTTSARADDDADDAANNNDNNGGAGAKTSATGRVRFADADKQQQQQQQNHIDNLPSAVFEPNDEATMLMMRHQTTNDDSAAEFSQQASSGPFEQSRLGSTLAAADAADQDGGMGAPTFTDVMCKAAELFAQGATFHEHNGSSTSNSPSASRDMRSNRDVSHQVNLLILNCIRLGFRLICMCATENEATAIAMSNGGLVPQILRFCSHPRKRIGAAEALVALFGHSALVDHADDRTTIDAVLKLVKKQVRESTAAVQLLATMCFGSGRAVRVNQSVVGAELLRPSLVLLSRQEIKKEAASSGNHRVDVRKPATTTTTATGGDGKREKSPARHVVHRIMTPAGWVELPSDDDDDDEEDAAKNGGATSAATATAGGSPKRNRDPYKEAHRSDDHVLLAHSTSLFYRLTLSRFGDVLIDVDIEAEAKKHPRRRSLVKNPYAATGNSSSDSDDNNNQHRDSTAADAAMAQQQPSVAFGRKVGFDDFMADEDDVAAAQASAAADALSVSINNKPGCDMTAASSTRIAAGASRDDDQLTDDQQRKGTATLAEFFEFYRVDISSSRRGADGASSSAAGSSADTSSRASIFSAGAGAVVGGFSQRLLSSELSPPAALLQQLRLVAALCADRHDENTRMVRVLYPYPLLSSIALSEELPGEFRAAVLQIILHAYLDVDPLPNLLEASQSPVFMWEDVVKSNAAKRSSRVFDFFSNSKKRAADVTFNPDEIQPNVGTAADAQARAAYVESQTGRALKRLVVRVKEYLTERVEMQIMNRDENACIESALQLVAAMIRTGWIEAADYSSWLDTVLTPLLDGRDDVSASSKWKRYEYDEHNRVIFFIKEQSIVCISMLALLMRGALVKVFVSAFEAGRPPPHLCSILDLRPRSRIHQLSLEIERARELEVAHRRQQHEAEEADASLWAKICNIWSGAKSTLSEIGFDLTARLHGTADSLSDFKYLERLIEVLCDNTCYHYPPLVRRSLVLFLEITNLQYSMLPSLKSLQLLTSSSNEQFYNEMCGLSHRLARYYRNRSSLSPQELGHVRRHVRRLYDCFLDICEEPSQITRDERLQIVNNLGFQVIAATLCVRIAPIVTPSLGGLARADDALLFCTKFLSESLDDPKLTLKISHEMAPFVKSFSQHLSLFPDLLTPVLRKVLALSFEVCRAIGSETIENIVAAVTIYPDRPGLALLLRLLCFQSSADDSGDGAIVRNQRLQSKLLQVMQHTQALEPLVRLKGFFLGRSGLLRVTNIVEKGEYADDACEMMTRLELILTIVFCARDRGAEARISARHLIFGSHVISSVEAIAPMLDRNPIVAVPFCHSLSAIFLADKGIMNTLCENSGAGALERILQRFVSSFADFCNQVRCPDDALWAADEEKAAKKTKTLVSIAPLSARKHHGAGGVPGPRLTSDAINLAASINAGVQAGDPNAIAAAAALNNSNSPVSAPAATESPHDAPLSPADGNGSGSDDEVGSGSYSQQQQQQQQQRGGEEEEKVVNAATAAAAAAPASNASGSVQCRCSTANDRKRQAMEHEEKLRLQETDLKRKSRFLAANSFEVHSMYALLLVVPAVSTILRHLVIERREHEGSAISLLNSFVQLAADLLELMLTQYPTQKVTRDIVVDVPSTNATINVGGATAADGDDHRTKRSGGDDENNKNNNDVSNGSPPMSSMQRMRRFDSATAYMVSYAAAGTAGTKVRRETVHLVNKEARRDARQPSTLWHMEAPTIAEEPVISKVHELPLVCFRQLAELLDLAIEANMLHDPLEVQHKVDLVSQMRYESDHNELLAKEEKEKARRKKLAEAEERRRQRRTSGAASSDDGGSGSSSSSSSSSTSSSDHDADDNSGGIFLSDTRRMAAEARASRRLRNSDGVHHSRLLDKHMGKGRASLQDQWQAFVTKFEHTASGIKPETAFRTPALIALRLGRLGHRLMKSVSRSLESPFIARHDRLTFLALLRQALLVSHERNCDAAIVLPRVIDDFHNEPPAVRVLKRRKMLSIEKTRTERQVIMSTWGLAPKIVRLVSTSAVDLTKAALQTGIALLHGGNATCQNSLYAYFLSTNRETFFFVCRTYMQRTREQVLERNQLIRNEAEDRNLVAANIDVIQDVGATFDFSVVILMLRFLQQATENHHQQLQEYFRVQPDNSTSVNLLEPIVNLLETVVNVGIDSLLFELASQLLSTLTEAVQGPEPNNQRFLIAHNAGAIVTKILADNHPFLDDGKTWQICYAGVTFLLGLLEGITDAGKVATLMSTVKLEVLVRKMDQTYEEWRVRRGDDDETDMAEASRMFHGIYKEAKDIVRALVAPLQVEDERSDGLNLATSIFTFMKTVMDIEQLHLAARGLDPTDENNMRFVDLHDEKNVVKAFRDSTSFRKLHPLVGHVEILRAGKVETIYFRVPHEMRSLTEESRDRLIREVRRTGDAARLSDFVERCVGLLDEMEVYESMRRTRGLSLVQKYSPVLEMLALLIAFVINIISIVFSEWEYQDENSAHLPPGTIETLFNACGILLIALQTLLFINFFFSELKVHIHERWSLWQENITRAALKEAKSNLQSAAGSQVDARAKLSSIEIFVFELYFFFSYPSMYKFGLFLLLAVVGFRVSPVAYAVQPLQIVWRSPTLYKVVEAVIESKRVLLVTFVLLIVCINIYSAIGYHFFSDMFDENGFGSGNCDSMARCFFSATLVRGVGLGGGVGEAMAPPIFTSQRVGTYALRQLYIFLYFATMVVLFLNLVFGVILDSFASLRQKAAAVEEEQEGYCFICSITADDLDKTSIGGFAEHVKTEHRMWDYLALMLHVQKKERDSRTGAESYVADAFRDRNIKWFPLGRALCFDFQPNLHQQDTEHNNSNAGGGGGAAGASGAADDHRQSQHYLQRTASQHGAAAAATSTFPSAVPVGQGAAAAATAFNTNSAPGLGFGADAPALDQFEAGGMTAASFAFGKSAFNSIGGVSSAHNVLGGSASYSSVDAAALESRMVRMEQQMSRMESLLTILAQNVKK